MEAILTEVMGKLRTMQESHQYFELARKAVALMRFLGRNSEAIPLQNKILSFVERSDLETAERDAKRAVELSELAKIYLEIPETAHLSPPLFEKALQIFELLEMAEQQAEVLSYLATIDVDPQSAQERHLKALRIYDAVCEVPEPPCQLNDPSIRDQDSSMSKDSSLRNGSLREEMSDSRERDTPEAMFSLPFAPGGTSQGPAGAISVTLSRR